MNCLASVIFIGSLLTYGCLCDQTIASSTASSLGSSLSDPQLSVDRNSTVQFKQLDPIERIGPGEAQLIAADSLAGQPSPNSTVTAAASSLKASELLPPHSNQTGADDLRPVSLNNLLDRIYRKNDLASNSTQFREFSVIDSAKDMQTAAHKHHKVVEHHQ